jgi:hypothetical protein
MKSLSESILKSVKAGKHSIESIIVADDYSLDFIKRKRISLDYLKDVLAQIVALNPKITKAELYYNNFFWTPEVKWLLFVDGFKKSVCTLVYQPEINHNWAVEIKNVFPYDPLYKVAENIRKTLNKIKK